VDRRSIAWKVPVLGAAAGAASLLLFAGPASAHTAHASVQRECAPPSTRATVTITNDFDLPAVVTYSTSKVTVSMEPNGSAAVSFTLNEPTTLTYSVSWSDGFQQGNRSVSVEPLTNCVITTTTPTTAPPSTAPPPSEAPTTVPATTVPESVLPPEVATTSPTVLGVEVQPQAAPKPAAVKPAQLPATGSSDAVPLAAVGIAVVVTGALLIAVRRFGHSS
jgi:LPXTG-motif cell wall-anchored protein